MADICIFTPFWIWNKCQV